MARLLVFDPSGLFFPRSFVMAGRNLSRPGREPSSFSRLPAVAGHSFTLSAVEGPLATAVSSASCVFYSHVAKFSEVLIERGNWGVFGFCSRSD
jgi:hypothetical protein